LLHGTTSWEIRGESMGLPIFLKQFAFRSGAIFLVKLIGAFVRIPLFRLLGAEGIGLYQMAYSFYGLILTIVMCGFPTALSLTTARDVKRGLRMLKISTVLIALTGSLISFLIFRYAEQIAGWIGDLELTPAIQMLAPAIFIAPLLSLIRGFLQGIEYYGSIAISEVIEQTIRVVTMLSLATLWFNRGLSTAVGGATLGAFTGALAAFLFLFTILCLHQRKLYQTQLNHQKPSVFLLGPGLLLFFQTSLAIYATRLILPISDFLDALIIPHRLQDSGLNFHQATAVFGEISGMAATIVYIPTIITSALSHILATKLTTDWEKKKKGNFLLRSRKALELGWLWGISSSLVLFFYAKDLSLLVCGDLSLTKAISYLSIAPLITGLRDLSTTILWVMEKKQTPFLGLILGTIFSVGTGYFLVGIHGFGYEGASISLLTLELIATLWNIRALTQHHRGITWMMPLFFETFIIVTIAIFCFQLTNRWLYQIQVSIFIQQVGKIAFSYLCIGIYMFIRFLNFDRIKIFFF
jgi:stage V sporulation protein B